MDASPAPVSARSRYTDRFKAELSLAMKSFFCQILPTTNRFAPVSRTAQESDVNPRLERSAPFAPAQFAQINSHFRRYLDRRPRSSQTTAAESRKANFPSANAVAAILIKPQAIPDAKLSENYISCCKMNIIAVTM